MAKKAIILLAVMALVLAAGIFLANGRAVVDGESVSYFEAISNFLLGGDGEEQGSGSTAVLRFVPSAPKIEIVNSSYFDKFFQYNFSYASTDRYGAETWTANFSIDQNFYAPAKACVLSGPEERAACFDQLCADFINDTSCDTFAADLGNLSKYPLKNLTAGWTFGKLQFDSDTGSGTFEINFPGGLKNGLLAKLGFKTTTITVPASGSNPSTTGISTEKTLVPYGADIGTACYNAVNQAGGTICTNLDGGAGDDVFFTFNYTLPNGSIDWIYVRVNMSSTAANDECALGARDFVNNRWQGRITTLAAASCDDATGQKVLAFNVSGNNLTNYVGSTSGGNVVMVVVAYLNGSSADDMKVDFAELQVKYNASTWFSSQGYNTSTVMVGSSVNHWGVAETSGTFARGVFGWNATGASCDSGWTNLTNVDISRSGITTNLTSAQTIPTACGGKNVAYRFYANTSDNRGNSTGGNYDVHTYGWLNVTWSLTGSEINNTCNATSPCGWANNTLKNASATVMCSGGAGALCGVVSSMGRYNQSDITPNNSINVTATEIPFNIYNGSIYSINVINVTENITNFVGDTGATVPYDNRCFAETFIPVYNFNLSVISFSLRRTSAFTNYSALIRIQNTASTLPILDGISNTSVSASSITTVANFYNFSLNKTIELFKDTTYAITICEFNANPSFAIAFNSSASANNYENGVRLLSTDYGQNYDAVTGDLDFALFGNRTFISEYSTNGSNLLSKLINYGDLFSQNLSINCTDNSSFPRVLDVYFNSSYGSALVPDNDTADAFYGKVSGSGPAVDDNATLVLTLSALNYSVTNASNLTVNVSVLASGGNGHQVNVSLWNSSKNNLTLNLTCAGFLATGQSCSVNVSINTSLWGLNSNASLHFNVTSNNTYVLPKWTGNFWVNVTSPPADTCTYSGSGVWLVDCCDNCKIVASVDLGGNDIEIVNSAACQGIFELEADIIRYGDKTIRGTNAANICEVREKGGHFTK